MDETLHASIRLEGSVQKAVDAASITGFRRKHFDEFRYFGSLRQRRHNLGTDLILLERTAILLKEWPKCNRSPPSPRQWRSRP